MTKQTFNRGKAAAAAAPRRYGKGFRHASETVRKQLDQVVGKKGFAESEVLLRWPEIAGEALAQTCRPVKVHYGANRNLGATLIVQTDSGRAPEVNHLAPKIIERMNRFYGYRAINRMKVTQSTGYGSAAPRATGFAEAQTPFSGLASDGPPKIRRDASELASGIENPELRAALEQMGSHVLSRAKSTKSGA